MTLTSERPIPPHWETAHPGTVLAPPPQTADRRRRNVFRRLGSEGVIVTFLALALYLAVGIVLDFHYLTFNGDAVSRMANGFYVLYSRDPHLAAIGFVWNPGTSIVDLIPLLFYHLWTPLASHMFAASLASAFCMAGAVYQVRCALAEWGVSRAPRLLLVALLGLNGMVVYYGGNGMSEGLYLFTLLATCRYLLRWLRNDDLASLIYSATALGLCYLARNEAAAPAVLGGIVVFAVGFQRRKQPRADASVLRKSQFWGGLADLTIFEMPFAASFVGWAVVSYVITGQPFQQFTSVYGTTSQIKVAGSQVFHARLETDLHDVFYLAPTLPLILVVALYLAARRRDIGILAPLCVVGGGLAFDLVAYAHNSIQPWFRYFITAVPLEVLLVGSFVAATPALIHATTPDSEVSARSGSRTRGLVGVVVALVLLVPASVTTVMGMANPHVGYEETQHLAFIFFKHPSAFDEEARTAYSATEKISDYFVNMHLADGQVIVDNFSGCVPSVITMSPNPDIWVIPNDRSFQRTLADPLTFHAHYILDVDPTGDGALTAPNISYPNLWKTGDGFTKVVHVFPSAGGCEEFKLFKVIGHPNQAS